MKAKSKRFNLKPSTRKRLERLLDERNESLADKVIGSILIGMVMFLVFLGIAMLAFSGSVDTIGR